MRRMLSYLGIAYLAASISYMLPYDTAPYKLISTGAQFICILLGIDY